MDIVIEPFDLKKDDTLRVAWLFYITDFEIMRIFFGKKEKAIPMLNKLVKLESNHFSHNHILCAKQNGVIIGLLSGFNGKTNRLIEHECANDYLKALGFLRSVRAGLVAFFMQTIMNKTIGDDEFFVNNLCVAPDNRNLGVGSALLSEIFKKYNKVSLGVNANNKKGFKFYVKNGFKMESEHKFTFMGRTIGACNMVWTRKGEV